MSVKKIELYDIIQNLPMGIELQDIRVYAHKEKFAKQKCAGKNTKKTKYKTPYTCDEIRKNSEIVINEKNNINKKHSNYRCKIDLINF